MAEKENKILTRVHMNIVGLLTLLWGSLRLGFGSIGSELQRLRRDPLALALVIFFTILYLPQALIVVDDIGLISSFETDPGSHIKAIESLLHSYNMNEGYHSKFYGWTYFALNYFLLMPLHLCRKCFPGQGMMPLYVCIRVIHFTIGLVSSLCFYALLRRVFLRQWLAGLGTFLYIVSPIAAMFFYFLHPETTGATFLFLAALSLVAFAKTPRDPRLYVLGLICMTLAALSKQIFFFASLPMLLGFLHFHCRAYEISYRRYFFSGHFIRIIFLSGVFSVVIFFLINPYAFIQLRSFIIYQKILGSFVNGENTLDRHAALLAWKQTVKSVPLFVVSMPLVVLSLIMLPIRYVRSVNPAYFLALVNLATALLVLTLVVMLNRLFITAQYFQPMYPAVIIVLLSALATTLAFSNKAARVVLSGVLLYAFALVAILSLQVVYTQLSGRLNYKESATYQTYNYVVHNLKPTDRLTYDHMVGEPNVRAAGDCLYWMACSEDLAKFDPDYIIFDESYKINNAQIPAAARLSSYVKDHHFQLVTKIYGGGGQESIIMSVYKRPETKG